MDQLHGDVGVLRRVGYSFPFFHSFFALHTSCINFLDIYLVCRRSMGSAWVVLLWWIGKFWGFGMGILWRDVRDWGGRLRTVGGSVRYVSDRTFGTGEVVAMLPVFHLLFLSDTRSTCVG